jgi:dienelactone hydrolase
MNQRRYIDKSIGTCCGGSSALYEAADAREIFDPRWTAAYPPYGSAADRRATDDIKVPSFTDLIGEFGNWLKSDQHLLRAAVGQQTLIETISISSVLLLSFQLKN